ncbi:hypothetical protein D9M69_378290 [compost metagenome]
MTTCAEPSRPMGYLYNPEKDVVEVITSFTKSATYQSHVFLTNEEPVFSTSDPLAQLKGKVDIRDQSLRFYSQELYLAVVKQITAIMRVHGDNQEVFGPPGHQSFIMDFKRSRTLGMLIYNEKMLRAMDKIQAGVSINGSIVDEGTVVTYTSLIEYLNQSVDRNTGTLSERIRAAVMRQWQEAIREDVALCSAHFVRGSTNYDDFLTVPDAAEYLKVSKTSINRYRDGHVPAGYAPFPNPDKYHGRSPLWMKSTLAVWAASKR